MLYLETVDAATLELLKRIQALPLLFNTRLVGGTALALQLGHRLSVDLDFFGEWGEDDLDSVLKSCGSAVRTGGKGRLQFYEINGIKVDCATYTYPWLREPLIEDGICLAHIEDIAAMKLEAVTNRGRKKDFIDLVFLLDKISLSEMLTLYQKKFSSGVKMLVLRSLVYFDDAEDDPMPVMLKPIDWESVKERIRQAVRKQALS